MSAVAIFKHSVLVEIKNLISSTLEAQKLTVATTPAEQALMDYKDGEKLVEMVTFVRMQALKHFGHYRDRDPPAAASDTAAFDAAYIGTNVAGSTIKETLADALAEAEATRDRVRARRRQALSRIYTLARPAVPSLLLSVLCSSLDAFILVPPLITFFMPLLKSVISKFNPDAQSTDDPGHADQVQWQAWQCILGVAVCLLMRAPVIMLWQILQKKGRALFSTSLRREVMRAICKQDTEVCQGKRRVYACAHCMLYATIFLRMLLQSHFCAINSAV